MSTRHSLKSRLSSPANFFSRIQLNFYRLHLVYFLSTIIVSSVIVYGSTTNGDSGNEEKRYHLRYIDALYLTASAMTNTGLNVINLASITGFQQAVLFLLIPMGNVMVVSTSVIYIRKHWFRKKMINFLEHSEMGRAICEDIERQEARSTTYSAQPSQKDGTENMPLTRYNSEVIRQRRRFTEHHLYGHGGFPFPWQTKRVRDAFHRPFQGIRRRPHNKPHNYLSFQPELDYKGRFQSLDEKQKAELGGVEYRALTLLGWLLPAYLVFWFLIGVVILVPYSYHHSVSEVILTSQPGNLNPGWWAVFTIMSAFSNCGINLLDSNMVPMQGYYLILIVVGAMILVGNQLFPVFLRFTIWLLYKIARKDSQLHHTCAFLLHHPRRCFVLLFPSVNTWYLLTAQLGIDFVLWAFFGILNVGMPEFDSIPAGKETVMGLFQSLGVRVGGLYVVLISNIAPALQIMYLVGMYISGFPIIISLRQTNVYEERSLGLDDHSNHPDPEKRVEKSYLTTHIKKQLAYDLWWLALAIFLITIIERGELNNTSDEFSYFSIWAIIFEVFSAYGTVGLSIGVPFDNYSFSGVWHTLSKLILITVMIRGRHRGLPYAIDRAVLLPGEELMEKMDKEVNERGSRRWKYMEERVKRDEDNLREARQDLENERTKDRSEDEGTKTESESSARDGLA